MSQSEVASTDPAPRPRKARGMLGLKKRRRIQVIVLAAAALALATGFISYGLRDGINLYRTPAQVLETPPDPGEVFRIGGLIEEGTLARGEGTTVTFRVTDGGVSVPVSVPPEVTIPDLFGEGEGVVALGRYEDGLFTATQILAKHDENYMPKEVIDALKDQGVYVAPAE